jgi:hypothetical protein
VPARSRLQRGSQCLVSAREQALHRAAVRIVMTTDPAVAKSGCLFYLVRSREALAS